MSGTEKSNGQGMVNLHLQAKGGITAGPPRTEPLKQSPSEANSQQARKAPHLAQPEPLLCILLAEVLVLEPVEVVDARLPMVGGTLMN